MHHAPLESEIEQLYELVGIAKRFQLTSCCSIEPDPIDRAPFDFEKSSSRSVVAAPSSTGAGAKTGWAARQRGLQRLGQMNYAVAGRDGKVPIIEREPTDA
ncbi:hypothetical protein [Lichenicoccus sp.]|uniref:hypothetical protein n=1 Tax=Lichenicoccus sp. TaxID=2781899 RepID=UPI003D0A6323